MSTVFLYFASVVSVTEFWVAPHQILPHLWNNEDMAYLVMARHDLILSHPF